MRSEFLQALSADKYRLIELNSRAFIRERNMIRLLKAFSLRVLFIPRAFQINLKRIVLTMFSEATTT